ncbi:MAG: nucleotidyltransferase family protein [Desulfobacteraceae bacterium]
MSTLDPQLVKIFNQHKEEIKNTYSVESLSVFGSVIKGTAEAGSDIDILVKYRETPGLFAFIDLKRYLESIVRRPVDLVTENALKKQLRNEILKEAVRVA